MLASRSMPPNLCDMKTLEDLSLSLEACLMRSLSSSYFDSEARLCLKASPSDSLVSWRF
jgi:hypothetical protein